MLFLLLKKKKNSIRKSISPNKNTVDTNYAFFQTLKQKLAEIFQSKGEAFYIKVTIWKSKKKIRYALFDSHIKVNQEFDLVIINSKLVIRLGFGVRSINTLANHCLSMSVVNSDFIELKSWVKF